MADRAAAVIYDVDGVLLDLTQAEEDAFFAPFERRYGLTGLSRDWDSYAIRNDEDIIGEILARHGLPAAHRQHVIAEYLEILRDALSAAAIVPVEIPGARALLGAFEASHALGIATANLGAAAQLRLEARDLWQPVRHLAFGAEGGGHKTQTVARAIAATGLPKNRIVYVGDNLNDVTAGLSNGVAFIGFSTDAQRRATLAAAGATHLAASHEDTADLIVSLLND